MEQPLPPNDHNALLDHLYQDYLKTINIQDIAWHKYAFDAQDTTAFCFIKEDEAKILQSFIDCSYIGSSAFTIRHCQKESEVMDAEAFFQPLYTLAQQLQNDIELGNINLLQINIKALSSTFKSLPKQITSNNEIAYCETTFTFTYLKKGEFNL